MAPSTPPPPSSVEFAALTMASTSSAVMSPRTISITARRSPAALLPSTLLARDLRPFLARLRKRDGDGLLAALHRSALSTASALQRSALASAHRALDAFARGLPVLSPARAFLSAARPLSRRHSRSEALIERSRSG